MKKRILLSSLLALSIVGCTNPIFNNTNQYSDLDQEYSQFKTKALTQSYLKKKMDKWLSDGKYSKNLVREIEYAKFKHKDLLKDIVALQPTMFNSITGNTGVSQKRVESPFENYIQYINPYAIAPTATSATAITSSSFTANWNSVSNATGYKLYIDGIETILGNVTTYNITGLVDASSHSYYVKASNSAGDSSVSNTINLTLLSALPLAPTANTASAITSTSFTANWNSVSNATGYKLYIDGTPITLGLVTSYNKTGLVEASSHNYYVKATNSAGDSSVSNTINLTLLLALPIAPTALNASNITQTSFKANWNSVSNATGYKLFVNGSEIYSGANTNFNVTSLGIGSANNYYVKAINGAGESANSNQISVTLDPPTDLNLFQTLSDVGAVDFKVFDIGTDKYMASAYYATNSPVYKLNKTSNQFEFFQNIPTNGSTNVSEFKINGDVFIAISCHFDGSTYNLNSPIYKWNSTTNKFEFFQNIPTNGGTFFENFVIDGDTYLAIANSHYNGTRNINSHLYKFDSAQNKFVLYQSIPTMGGISWSYLNMGTNHYLAVVNYQNVNDFNVNSVVYKWNSTTKLFDVYQNIPYYAGHGVEMYTYNNKSYLVLTSLDSAIQYAYIYRWNTSTNLFELLQTSPVSTNGALTPDLFEVGASLYLSIPNVNGSKSAIYKLNNTTGLFELFKELDSYNCHSIHHFVLNSIDYIIWSNYQAASKIYKFN